jgi:hypothetical protein
MARAFRLRPSTVHERFGDETVILNLESGSYYSIQGTGNAIWELVSNGTSETVTRRRIQEDFVGPSEHIAGAVSAFIDQLVAEALVDAESAPEAGDDMTVASAAAPQEFVEPLLQKYTDMEEMLLLDPIHEVDEHGWPSARKDA